MKQCLIVLIAIFILLAACDIKKPVVPKWDVMLTVPLLNEKYYVSDLVDSIDIFVDDDLVLQLRGSGDVTSSEFGNIDYNPGISLTNQQIPPLATFNLNLDLPADSPVHVSYSDIASGAFVCNFDDVDPSVNRITMTFGNIKDTAGNNLVHVFEPGKGRSTVNLQGYHLGDAADTTQVITTLPITLDMTYNSTPPNAAIATLAFIANTPLQLSYLRGIMDPRDINLEEDSASITIEYPNGVDEAITLLEASMHLEIENQIGFEAEFSGRLFASNDAGDTISVAIVDHNDDNYVIAAAGTTTIEINEGIAPLLSIMPNSMEIINGKFRVSSGGDIGQVRTTDVINVDYNVNAPFHFDLHDNEIVVEETQSVEIAAENRERILKNALNADITMDMLNMLPVGARARVYFSASSDSIDVNDSDTYSYCIPKKTEAAILINAASSPNVWQTVPITLTKDELNLFAEPKVYYTWTFSFVEASDVTIYARTIDYIHIRSMLKAKLLVEDL